MKYNFEKYKSRKDTGSYKWNAMYNKKKDVEEGIVPLSVADMEFESAPYIYEGLKKWLDTNPIFGYTGPNDEYYQSVISWMKNRHGMTIEKEYIVNTPGVVNAIRIAVNAFSKEGDGVINFKPVYNPFENVILSSNRREVNVPLLEDNGYYTIDFDKFEEEAKNENNKIVILCNPHNPVGRVWSEEEILKIEKIVVENDLIIISDEIWFDIINPNNKHFSVMLTKELVDRAVVCTAISKTFNLAGLSISNILIKNKSLREKFVQKSVDLGLNHVNIVGLEATKIVYNNSEKWVDEMIDVVYENQRFVKVFFENNYPKVKAKVSEGTYVQWIDFRQLNLNKEELDELMINSNLFSSDGYAFGEEGLGFERINVAIPRDRLEIILNNLLEQLKKL